jgi:hypothetical protein
LKPVGIADLTASTASDAMPHSPLLRNSGFLVAAATSTIAQVRFFILRLILFDVMVYKHLECWSDGVMKERNGMLEPSNDGLNKRFYTTLIPH